MIPHPAWQAGLCLCLIATGAAAAEALDPSALPPPAQINIDYARDIRPILESTCLRCHGPLKTKSYFRLDNRDSALEGGDHGVDILPGNSAKSPLVYYAARLVPDMEMPPNGKGEPLTKVQVALLRAWIDQGARWAGQTNWISGSITTAFGGAAVKGDIQKFKELNWTPAGFNGGIQKFDFLEQLDPNTRAAISGHALVDDYKLQLSIVRVDQGFIEGGWEQYRKYYDTFGGYDPASTPVPSILDSQLHLDIGRAWINFGLTKPTLPRLTFGYEYDYRNGNEATLDWGPDGSGINAKNLSPNSQQIDEGRQIIKFALSEDIGGLSLEDEFRGELYNLNTRYTNVVAAVNAAVVAPPLSESAIHVSESTSYLQGANFIRGQDRLTDWLLATGGYLYSQLSADSSFSLETRTLPGFTDLGDQQWSAPDITLQEESHVGNVDALLGPWSGLTISTGAQGEYTRQTGWGADSIDVTTLPSAFPNNPSVVAATYDESSIQETVGLRYSQIPFTGLFADVRLEQQSIKQLEQLAATASLPSSGSPETTDFSRDIEGLRTGFNTAPWRAVSFGADYHFADDNNHYQNGPGPYPPDGMSYPGFIEARDETQNAFEARITLKPWNRLTSVISYRYDSINYNNTTENVPPNVSPGGSISAAEYFSHNVSLHTTWLPWRRLSLSSTLSFERATTETASAGSTAVVPYQGNIYTALLNATYTLGPKSDLFAGYEFFTSDYGESDFTTGVPLGINYHEEDAHAGLRRKFTNYLTGKLEYRFERYTEPTGGNIPNFTAHIIFLTMTYNWL